MNGIEIEEPIAKSKSFTKWLVILLALLNSSLLQTYVQSIGTLAFLLRLTCAVGWQTFQWDCKDISRVAKLQLDCKRVSGIWNVSVGMQTFQGDCKHGIGIKGDNGMTTQSFTSLLRVNVNSVRSHCPHSTPPLLSLKKRGSMYYCVVGFDVEVHPWTVCTISVPLFSNKKEALFIARTAWQQNYQKDMWIHRIP
jgi:hypothetical protein